MIHDEIPCMNNEESTETHRLETVESDQPNLDDIDLDLEGLKDLKSKHFHNPFISHLNINSLRYKITELREILTKSNLEILTVSETKLDDQFPDNLFHVDGYHIFRRDRNSFGGGLMTFIKSDIPSRRREQFESTHIKMTCVEITISKRKWAVISVYRPPRSSINTFFSELTKFLDIIIDNYENLLILGDLNIDSSDSQDQGINAFHDFCDVFDLRNLIKGKTCITKKHSSSIDVILTNKKRLFKNSGTIETGVSDFHKMVLTMLREQFKKLKPIQITYRDYRKFDQTQFLEDLSDAPFHLCEALANHDPSLAHDLLVKIFKKQRNLCASLRRKNIKRHFENLTFEDQSGNRSFWKAIKPYLTNNGKVSNDNFILYENSEFISDEKDVAEVLNDFYINIVEQTTGEIPVSFSAKSESNSGSDDIQIIIDRYESHPSILQIKEQMNDINTNFEFQQATEAEITSYLTSLNPNKPPGYDKIPPKLVKFSSDILSKPLTMIINSGIRTHIFPENEKIASVTPVYKSGDKLRKENYRPISILNVFSKVFERFLYNQLNAHFNNILSQFLSAYRKHFSTQHVLLRIIENWKLHLDNNKIVGAILMDLSKAFDCLPHELIIAKLAAYGLGKRALQVIFSYLKNRKQSVKVKGIQSLLKLILSGVPQGSLLGPILFNIFINDLFYFINSSDLHNFADDNTISAIASSVKDLVTDLERKACTALDWLDANKMIANPEKFKAIILQKPKSAEVPDVKIQIRGQEVAPTQEVELLGIKIDNELEFDKYISKICKKAANQLNALYRLGKYLNLQQREVLVKSFILANFNYCPMVWHFCSCKNTAKIERIHKRALKFMLNDFTSDYETLIAKANTSTLEVKRLRSICTEIYKTANDLNAPYMKELFVPRNLTYALRGSQNLSVPRVNQTTYGLKSIRYQGPKIWNSLPADFHKASSLDEFKNLMKTWNGPTCNCNFCKYWKY